jgi:hypothetical protein
MHASNHNWLRVRPNKLDRLPVVVDRNAAGFAHGNLSFWTLTHNGQVCTVTPIGTVGQRDKETAKTQQDAAALGKLPRSDGGDTG